MKEFLRKTILKKREELPLNLVLSKSKQIEEKLFKLPEFLNAKKLMVYVSFKKEVFTHSIIKRLLQEKKFLTVPVMASNNKIIASRLKNFSELEKNSIGLLEPKKEFIRKINPKDLDLIIVPGIAFSENGARIGYGFGYYDIFLSKLSSKTLKIGLSFELQLTKNIPVEAHDIKMNKIITEKRIISC
jgi:5-formyltetrahydrofolate cyclo-ligase